MTQAFFSQFVGLGGNFIRQVSRNIYIFDGHENLNLLLIFPYQVIRNAIAKELWIALKGLS